MTYELAKRLKDAGFPLNPIEGGAGITATQDDTPYFEYVDGTVYWKPTLSELIEACGNGLAEITRLQPDEWEAHSYVAFSGQGHTPEEAVAKLWLELNKKL